MGQSESSSVVNALTEQITNISQSSVQSCLVSTDQSQSLKFVNNGSSWFTSSKMKQATDVTSSCMQDVARNNKLVTDIAATIANDAKAAASFGSSKAEALTNITNILTANITTESINKQYTLIKQDQSAEIINNGRMVGNSFDMSQGAEVYAAAILKTIDNAGVFTKIQNDIDNSASAEGFSLFGLSNIMSYIMIAFVAFILIIVGVVVYNMTT